MSPIMKILSGCRSLLLRLVVSHRRQVHMILNNRSEEFNNHFVVRMENIDYTLFVTSSALKCFNCGKEGHLARACPNCPGTATGPPPPAPASVSDCSEASHSPISDGQVKNVDPAEMYKVFLQRTKGMKGLDLKNKTLQRGE